MKDLLIAFIVLFILIVTTIIGLYTEYTTYVVIFLGSITVMIILNLINNLIKELNNETRIDKN